MTWRVPMPALPIFGATLRRPRGALARSAHPLSATCAARACHGPEEFPTRLVVRLARFIAADAATASRVLRRRSLNFGVMGFPQISRQGAGACAPRFGGALLGHCEMNQKQRVHTGRSFRSSP